MNDTVKLALIGMIGSLFTTVGVCVVAYFQHGAKKIAKDTNAVVTETKQTVAAVQEQTNGRLTAAEAQVAELKAENERLRAEMGARRRDDP
jgi:cell division protein FtsB